ncbi:hypothetical protein RC74_07740 [Falsihalocynthiibacter arcticus]|uniref:Uncharacterized protein n=1 Tax=Falsihalocynthiibacter arcticus TaxID=1579316 RepID=A0A126UZM6_9RHOB|nr:hypothetical protein RC74_07740 [Falsihalocynthiibacter arcticus]
MRLGDEMRGDRGRKEQKQRDQQLMQREMPFDQNRMQDRRQKHAANTQCCGLGGRMKARHWIGQFDQTNRANKAKDAAHNQKERD